MGSDDRLRIRWHDPLPEGRRVVLRHRESGETRPAPVAADRRSLEVDVGELAAGTWEPVIEADAAADGSDDGTAGGSAGGAARPILTDDPGFSLDGLRAYAGRPRDRAVRAVRTRKGHARLRVRTVSPHAEVAAVHPHDGEIRIDGWLAYTGPQAGEPARLVAAPRDGGAAVTGEVVLDGTGFRGRLAVDALAAAEPALWDLWLDVGDVHARLGTWLDDAPGKRGKLSYPRQVAAPAGREMAVRPYYTERDQLAVSCRPVGDDGA
ncbi:hypothetical protein [Actinomadura nitritigenes]|uniref:Uncharacterized protein n=1 Tax=Actinomadura nitritigenes TaxID=134602 RepID=A0ABS3R1D7_9ACTN|nr:hypothetical protein [Actinomadura nitritigenes]MBO2439911.1 hypothetical protein [Actinomadura nitritigenes]